MGTGQNGHRAPDVTVSITGCGVLCMQQICFMTVNPRRMTAEIMRTHTHTHMYKNINFCRSHLVAWRWECYWCSPQGCADSACYSSSSLSLCLVHVYCHLNWLKTCELSGISSSGLSNHICRMKAYVINWTPVELLVYVDLYMGVMLADWIISQFKYQYPGFKLALWRHFCCCSFCFTLFLIWCLWFLLSFLLLTCLPLSKGNQL